VWCATALPAGRGAAHTLRGCLTADAEELEITPEEPFRALAAVCPRVSASETKVAAIRFQSSACANRQHACSPGRTVAQESEAINGACTVGPTPPV
jgi:hypothetical protein